MPHCTMSPQRPQSPAATASAAGRAPPPQHTYGSHAPCAGGGTVLEAPRLGCHRCCVRTPGWGPHNFCLTVCTARFSSYLPVHFSLSYCVPSSGLLRFPSTPPHAFLPGVITPWPYRLFLRRSGVWQARGWETATGPDGHAAAVGGATYRHTSTRSGERRIGRRSCGCIPPPAPPTLDSLGTAPPAALLGPKRALWHGLEVGARVTLRVCGRGKDCHICQRVWGVAGYTGCKAVRTTFPAF